MSPKPTVAAVMTLNRFALNLRQSSSHPGPRNPSCTRGFASMIGSGNAGPIRESIYPEYGMTTFSERRLDDQFMADLDRIAAWLVLRGVRRQNRFQLYRQNIAWLHAHDLDEDRARVHADFEKRGRVTEVLSTFVETIEMVETISTLMEAQITVPVELLRRAFSGPLDTFREDAGSNQARNAMFELTMGAMGARCGLSPVLSIANPDVQFDFENRRVSVECKRVISESKVLERIEEGIEQLTKSVRPGTDDVGIVAISLAKLFNPGDRIAVVPEGAHPNAMFSQELYQLLHRAEPVLARLTEPPVTAILFYLSSPCYVSGAGYTRASCGTIFPMNLDEQRFLSRLASNLIA
jgi:hypothetical protein